MTMSSIYPNLCYSEACYNEVEVYHTVSILTFRSVFFACSHRLAEPL